MPSSYILTFLILEFAAFSIEILQEKKNLFQLVLNYPSSILKG